MSQFEIVSSFKPAGDQIAAIKQLTQNIKSGQQHQTLLGVTGSGKTFTMANVIQNLQRPTLIISPNKILAAQLYAEFKQFFPNNAVEYFISFYDYYQPEAYVPQSDTYIEKDSSINDHIDRLRLKATSSLLERRDVLIVASVSCIYSLGSPQEYKDFCVCLAQGQTIERQTLLDQLIATRYERNDIEFSRGKFRLRGDTIEIFPAYLETALRVEFFDDTIERIHEFNPLTGEILLSKKEVFIYPAKHFVTGGDALVNAMEKIREELRDRLQYFNKHNKLLEAQRLEQRTRYDLELLKETGFCHGIENYSRHLSARKPGERPQCLLDYFPPDWLLMIDESHVTLPQVRAMHEGDRARKQTLVDYGFRLPSALDNRPLKFSEFEKLPPQTLYVSATPGPYELQKSEGEIVEQVIRPTGLVDPEIEIYPIKGQIDYLMKNIVERVAKKECVLITTLTKKMAEDLTSFLTEKNFRVRYLHSEVASLKRIALIQDMRKGLFDVLVGINLLREGLDLPQVSLIAVLDADKEGFLRSETTLIQICGRAARNANGKVILFADNITGSMQRAMDEMNRRRKKQIDYNKKHGITPKTIQKVFQELNEFNEETKKTSLDLLRQDDPDLLKAKNIPKLIDALEKQMKQAAAALDFETAALLRDQIYEVQNMRVK